MRCLGCKAWKDGKCLAGVVPYKSKKEVDGVGCNCNTRTIDKRMREWGTTSMGMYIPNMNQEQFYNLCKEYGLEIIAAPAADVRPVVLCRDCIHCRKGKASLECEKHTYAWNNMRRWVDEDDFCSWGVKKEES